MQLYNSTEAFKIALQDFPKWMDIRKRANTSLGGKTLKTMMLENDDIITAYKEFEKTFFLKYYAGKEDSVLWKVYTAHVGDLDDIELVDVSYELTVDPVTFTNDTKNYALYQNSYIIVDPDNVSDNKILYYTSDDETFSASLIEQELWNIFDEFALFSGLTRYPGETNLELTNRIYAVYTRPANSSKEGLKNAILNALINVKNVDEDDIVFEKPSSSNMYTEIDDETIYDKLSALNKDIAREKIWNHSNWENEFKQIEYISNEWDHQPSSYQNGTGQNDDLYTKLSGSSSTDDTTNVSVTGYKTSTTSINEYIHKQGIKKNIPLHLTRYRDELVGRNVKYKITATPAKLIDPSSIYIKSRQHIKGTVTKYLSDIILDQDDLTITSNGAMDTGAIYRLDFYPRDSYTDMVINKCNVIHKDGSTTNLLQAQGAFKYDDGVFRNTDVKLHAVRSGQLDNVNNIEDATAGGITLGTKSTVGSFNINTNGMGGMPIVTKVKCDTVNFTNNSSFVTPINNFKLISDTKIQDTDTDSKSSIIIDMDCASVGYTIEPNSGEQGAVSVQFEIDNELDTDKSGLKTKAETFYYDFGNLKHVRITITKAGIYPVTISNIIASRYRLTYSMKNDDIIYTATGMKLPLNADNNTLNVTVESFGTYAPIIEYLHIGPALSKVSYSIDKVTALEGDRFDIDTDCQVKLTKKLNSATVIESEDYLTKALYVNNTDHKVTAMIDTSNFVSISSSSKKISTASWKGITCGSIEVAVGESIDRIDIVGELLVSKEKLSLYSLLNLSVDDKLYVAGNAKNFILENKDGTTQLVNINRSSLVGDSDEFEFDSLPEGTNGVFVVSEANGTEVIDSKLSSRTFDYCYIKTDKDDEYIAYNEIYLLQSPTKNVEIVNTFSPYLDMNLLMFYKIDEIITTEGAKAAAKFAHGTDLYNWALGSRHNGITVEYEFDQENEEEYKLEVGNLNEYFTISNSIDLKNSYTIGETEYDLARYILTPPSDMKIVYTTKAAQESLYISEDGFNKLWYSNIKKIISIEVNGEAISSDKYILMDEAGIVSWKDMDDYVGEEAIISYEYRRPTSLEYKDLLSLYELVGYSIEAYEALNSKPITLSNMKDGDTKTVIIGDTIPDKLIAQCDNENFQVIIVDNKITVQRYTDAASTMVHTGYYYDGADEYYFFEHDYKESVDQLTNVNLNGYKRNADTLKGIQESNNFLLDTVMNNGDHYERICDIDLYRHQDRIEGISDLKNITACDSYQLWDEFNMNVVLSSGKNGLGIKFTPSKTGAYAVLDISKVAKKGKTISFYMEGNLSAAILQEVLAGSDSMVRSIFAEKLCDLTVDSDGYYNYSFIETPEVRTYLYISGEGIIDDIIVCDTADITISVHQKELSALGFIVFERAHDLTYGYEFDQDGIQYDGLDIGEDNTVETGSSVDYGVTQLYSFKENFGSFTTSNVTNRKNVFYTNNEAGSITSPWTYVNSSASIETLYIKINNVLIDPMRFFNVKIFTADDASGSNTREVFYTKKTNLAAAKVSLGSYVQIVVEMPASRVIESLEMYARYVEGSHVLHITPASKGTLTTKLYNAVSAGNFKLASISGLASRPDSIRIYIRGCRQDTDYMVFTKWYQQDLNKDLNVTNGHVFENYQYFQFKIELLDADASIRIDNFTMEAV